MRIAFATISDLRDVRRGSGTFYHLAEEIEQQGHKVFRLGPFDLDAPLFSRVVNGLHRRLRKRHPLFLDPCAGARTCLQVARRLHGIDYDLFLTNDMAFGAFTPTTRPVVIYTDVMIKPDYSEAHLPGCRLGNMSPLSLWLSRYTIRAALNRADLCVFPTEWSAQAARSYCGQADKIKVIPFGANVADPGREIANERTWGKLRAKGWFDLLFVGKDWVRKGGGIAVEAVGRLNASGLNARLHVVGAQVPGAVPPEQVLQHGLLDKSKPEDQGSLKRLFTEADAFILPSSSEGYVISVLEAAAFGLPTLAYDADGVRNAVVAGRTGLLFPLGSPAEVFAAAVRSWQSQPSAYEALARGAREHYETSANWPNTVRQLMPLIEAVSQPSGGWTMGSAQCH